MSLPTQAVEARCPGPPAPSACEARCSGHQGGSQPGVTTPGSTGLGCPQTPELCHTARAPGGQGSLASCPRTHSDRGLMSLPQASQAAITSAWRPAFLGTKLSLPYNHLQFLPSVRILVAFVKHVLAAKNREQQDGVPALEGLPEQRGTSQRRNTRPCGQSRERDGGRMLPCLQRWAQHCNATGPKPSCTTKTPQGLAQCQDLSRPQFPHLCNEENDNSLPHRAGVKTDVVRVALRTVCPR